MQRAWLREFNALGLQLRPKAAKLVTQFLQSCEDPQQMCEALVEHTKAYFKSRQGMVAPIIDEDVIQSVITCMEKASAENSAGLEDVSEVLSAARQGVDTMDLGDGVQVYNVMTDMRPYTFRIASKEWTPSTEKACLFPGVKSKIKIYSDRYHILWERLLVQGNFVPEVDAKGGALLPGQRVITPVESLVGNLGRKTTFGLISRAPQDENSGLARRWVIEDLHKSYPLEFVESQVGEWDHQLVTDGSFVIVEGEMAVDRFHVHRLQVPETIPRSLSQEKDQVPVQVFGGDLTEEQLNVLRMHEDQNPDGMYVVLSEVHLDNVKVLERLSDLFQGYEETTPPAAYIFMGNFYSSPFLPTQEGVRNYREGFERLKLHMRHVPNHVERGTRFIFIPGPMDPGANMLPRTPLTNYLTSDIAKDIPGVILGTNPCRVRHFSRELVFFRHDVLKLLRRHEVVPLREHGRATPSPQHLQNEMARLLLDQAHLIPLPLEESNILWDFDNALRLYPLPDAVFIGGVSRAFECEYKGCNFCSVGPFHKEGSFYSYSPIKPSLEACDVPDRTS
jgi:DNA polymerase epsilon subunit 2